MMAKQRKKSNKTLYILLGVVVVLILIAVIGKSAGFIGKKKELEVTLSEAKMTAIVEKVSASGTVRPVNEVNISPDVSGSGTGLGTIWTALLAGWCMER